MYIEIVKRKGKANKTPYKNKKNIKGETKGLKLHRHEMMNPKISLTSPITPEIKTQGCASVQQKGWKKTSLDLVLLLFTEEFPSLTAQDGALSLSSNQPIISKFRNNPAG